MSPCRTRSAAVAFALALALGGMAPRAHAGSLRDAPVVWYEGDRADVSKAPKERNPNLLWTSANETFIRPVGRLVNPVRLSRRVGTIFGGQNVHDASNVNPLGEVPNSTWFTNRIGLHPRTPEEVAHGPGRGEGPSTESVWTVTSGKTEGVTPGFSVKDGSGQTFLIKFDPPGQLGTTRAAAAITGRLLHAVGYNVPDDAAVTFTRDRLVVSPKATIRGAGGLKRTMTSADLDTMLTHVDRMPDGTWLAIASRFLDGKPIGPFSYKGRRADDPNDRLRHEDRRELRGLRMFCAWLDHWDMKEQNSLDMYVADGERHYVRHHLIDFASTLGAAAGPDGAQPRFGQEFTADFPAIGGRIFSLGFHEDSWRRSRRPEGLAEVGYFESRGFHPMEWKPLETNVAFANMNERDGYWAAKIISAFTDGQLRAAVAMGHYRSPEAAAYVARVLGERRDIIARYWFMRMPPLDFFLARDGVIRFHDLGAERHLDSGPARYRARCAAVNEHKSAHRWTDWSEIQDPELPLTSGPAAEAVRDVHPNGWPFLAVEVEKSRGHDWSRPVRAYVSRGSDAVVAVER
jgi:hypothetical protein